MARVSKYFKRLTKSFAGATKDLHQSGNREAEYHQFTRIWATVHGLRHSYDELAGRDRFAGGRPLLYKRSSLLGIHLVSWQLKMNLVEATNFVQSDARYRELLGFSPASPRTLEALRLANNDHPVLEQEFPRPQEVSQFMHKWAVRFDPNFELVKHEAYVELPYQLSKEFDCDLTAFNGDSTKVASGQKWINAKHPDVGAATVGRPDVGYVNGRYKHTLIGAKAEPVILGGACSTESEKAFVTGKDGLQAVAERAAEIDRRLAADGLRSRLTPTGGMFVGDGNYLDIEVYADAYDNGFIPACRPPHWPVRTKWKTFNVEKYGDEAIYQITSDHTVYCPCDRYETLVGDGGSELQCERPFFERVPMKVWPGLARKDGYTYITCRHGARCPFSGTEKIYLSRTRFHTVDGKKTDYTVVAAVDFSDARIMSIIDRGYTANEYYHSAIHRDFGFGVNDTVDRRSIRADASHEFAAALVDLLWNVVILLNLRDCRSVHKEWTIEESWKASIGMKRAICRRRQKGGETGLSADPEFLLPRFYAPDSFGEKELKLRKHLAEPPPAKWLLTAAGIQT